MFQQVFFTGYLKWSYTSDLKWRKSRDLFGCFLTHAQIGQHQTVDYLYLSQGSGLYNTLQDLIGNGCEPHIYGY